jgi:hypothetical protein
MDEEVKVGVLVVFYAFIQIQECYVGVVTEKIDSGEDYSVYGSVVEKVEYVNFAFFLYKLKN